MNKLFKLLQESFGSAPQRNGFDLSRRSIFSIKVGMKAPAFVMETVPNDFHEIQPVNVIKSFPMNESNYVRMKQNLDFYWVPMTAMKSNFNEFLQQTKDPISSLFSDESFHTTPSIGLYELVTSLIFASLVDNKVSGFTNLTFGDSASWETLRVYLGLGLDAPVNRYVEMFCEKFSSQNTTVVVSKDMFDNPIYLGTLRLLDLLGYGNYLQFVKMLTPIFTIDPETSQPVYDYEPSVETLSAAQQVLLENLYGKSVNLYRIGAYQCVHQNLGINTIYDRLDFKSYNFDDFDSNMNPGGNIFDRYVSGEVSPYKDVQSVFTLRYSQWKKDIFTSSYPDTQFGGVSVVSSNYLGIGNLSGTTTQAPVYRAPDGGLSRSGGDYINVRAFSTFSVLDLRRAEALQGWREDMMRSGFRSRSRQRSQFGVTPNYDPHMMPYVIGSTSQVLNKDTITGTSGDEFGHHRSNGESIISNDTIRFDGSGNNDFGIIIGLITMLPEADYDAFGVDPHNTKFEPFDFYTPAFQNIGLQPLASSALNILDKATLNSTLAKIHGYVPRYAEYKQAVDKVHGEFCKINLGEEVPYFRGKFREFVSTRYDMEAYGLTALGSLYVNPAIEDDIFVQNADAEQATDQFTCNCYFEVRSVRPMSVLGLPRFT